MTDQDKPYVRYEVSGGAATITLDSPHNRNAISTRLVTELQAGLTVAAADPAVRAVVLTHTGGTFCAGADLSEASGSSASPEDAVKERGRGMLTLLRSILELPKPVIGRIDGHVRAGGMGLVGACDIVVAGPASTFAVTESRLGLAASIISLTVLPSSTSDLRAAICSPARSSASTRPNPSDSSPPRRRTRRSRSPNCSAPCANVHRRDLPNRSGSRRVRSWPDSTGTARR